MHLYMTAEQANPLSPREAEILQHVLLLETNREIAEKLGTSPYTVGNQALGATQALIEAGILEAEDRRGPGSGRMRSTTLLAAVRAAANGFIEIPPGVDKTIISMMLVQQGIRVNVYDLLGRDPFPFYQEEEHT